jgi:prefoldin subunit 5
MKEKIEKLEKLVKNTKRQLDRLNLQKQNLEQKYNGNEQKYTFHGGRDLGYLQGRTATLEDSLDDLESLLKSLKEIEKVF